jgi:hypothetical protein
MSEPGELRDYVWSVFAPDHAHCDGREYDDKARRMTCTCGIALYGFTANDALEVSTEQAILAAIEGHQTYAITTPSDSGWTAVDEFAQCRCQACAIARAARIGFAECMRQRAAFYKGIAARSADYDRVRYAVMFPPGSDEVPF